jgi:anti-sigma B factor antagonist
MHRLVTTFRLIGREAGPTRRVLQVHGELGLADVDRLEEALAEAAVAARDIVVGLEGCEFIDSIALAAILRARDRLAEKGTLLVIAGPTGQVRRILEISGLNLDGFLFDSVDQAILATG